MDRGPLNLLDTHVVVWAVNCPDYLSPAARAIIESGDYAISAVSFWELMLKRHRRDAPVRDPCKWWRRHVANRDVTIFPLQWYELTHLDTLADLHRDPFDRALLCQSLHQGMRLVSKDPELHRYQGACSIVW